MFLPLLLFVFISWGVFWIDPELVAAQISLGAISMLNLIEHQFAVRHPLPRISLLTRTHKFALASALLVFLALVEAILTARLFHRGKTHMARAVDRSARWAFPAVFAAMVLFVLVL